MSSNQANRQSRSPMLSRNQQPHHGDSRKVANCICPLHAYKRYDKMDPVRAQPEHYPKEIKTVYRRDYTPKKADNEKLNFSPIRTAKRSEPTRDNYLTTFQKDYTPKAARSTTPIKLPEHNYHRDAPLANKTEYKDMTQSAGDRITFSPLKNARDKPKPVSAFGDHTEYQQTYTPKRNSTAKTDLPGDSNLIFRGHTHKKIGPFEDQTVYKRDYTPKKLEGPRFTENSAFRESNWDARPKVFDDLTIYKKDYTGPGVHDCTCPYEESAQESRVYPTN